MSPQIARLGGLTTKARYGGEAMTRPARQAAERAIRARANTNGLDPITDRDEISAREEAALRAHRVRMGIASGRARRAKRDARLATSTE